MTKIVHIVDDEEIVRDSLALLLRLQGFETRVYASGDEFLGKYDSRDAGCILLDLKMPGLDGLQVIQELGECGSRVILLSGQMDPALGARAIMAGAFEVIEKPYDPQTLSDALAQAFDAPSLVRATSSRPRLT